jgi:FtsP/CotA-like multicopper oxidase with cupredoxin domain
MLKMNRRDFLKFSAASGGALMAARVKFYRGLASYGIFQTPLLGKSIPKYVDFLPVFGDADDVQQGQVNAPREEYDGSEMLVSMEEVQQKVLPKSFYDALAPEFQSGTWVWAYRVTSANRANNNNDEGLPLYPGVTIEAIRGIPMHVKYTNNLPHAPILNQYVTTDQSIHWADPDDLDMMDTARMLPYDGTPPVAVHLHGGEVSSKFDGGPDQWFTPDGKHGSGYETFDNIPVNSNEALYEYVNEQEAATLWFHDHALGATRLNVYRGLAAFYLLRDEFDTGKPDNKLGLPAGGHEREIAFQDRMFDTNGQWYFPDGTGPGLNGPPPNPLIHPFWNPEFFGDVMVVNGKSWPFLEVEPRRYRFRLLDGCNARFLELRLMNRDTHSAGPAIWVIGTDGGLLDKPVKLNDPKVPANKAPRLLMAPGERYDVIIDFAGCAGQTFTLVNSAKGPYPNGMAPDPSTTGQVMEFRVTLPLSGTDASFNPASGASLRGETNQPPKIVRLVDPVKGTLAAGVSPKVTRQLVLVEVEGLGGPIEVLVNNTKWDGTRSDTMEPIPGVVDDGHGNGISESPQVGSTEVWEIVNLTMDAHPMHLHLTQFQLMNRQMFNLTKYRALYDSLFPGGTYGGQLPDGTWGEMSYPAGVFIPAYGPPLPIDGSDPRSAGKLGGNPDVKPFLQDGIMPPKPEEAGWKDVVKMYPGQVSRIVVRFAPQDTSIGGVQPGENKYSFDPTEGPGYVWHCHIVDHEDNEMMRPYKPVN